MTAPVSPVEQWKIVPKAELDAFVSAYPRPLVRDVARICDPPMLSYNDFSEGKVWPESMVAKVVLASEYGQPDEHYLRKETP